MLQNVQKNTPNFKTPNAQEQNSKATNRPTLQNAQNETPNTTKCPRPNATKPPRL